MMRDRIVKIFLVLTYVCSFVLGEAARADANKPPPFDGHLPSCPPAENRYRDAMRACMKPDPHRRPLPLQRPRRESANKELSPEVNRRQLSPAEQRNGHFDAAGGTGLIPVGRMGWHEIGSWREMHRVRNHKWVP